MIVSVRCLADLAGSTPPDGRLTLPETATVGFAADRLGIAPEAVGTFLVNSAPADRTAPLAPGDVLTVIPPITGG